MQDLKTFRQWPKVMDAWDRMFTEYPKMAGEVMNAMFVVDGKPAQPLKSRIMPIVKRRGIFKLFGEVRRALKAL